MPALTDPVLPFDLDKLFQDARPELETVDASQFVRRIVSRARVVELTDITSRSFAPLVEQLDELIVAKVAEQRRLEYERVYRRAWVFYAAELAAEERRANTGRLEQQALAKRVAEHDRFLFRWATPVFAEHDIHGETLRDISRGVGFRDDAEDVLRLVALFRDQWDTVAQQVPAVTKEYLDQAAADASRQLALLGNPSVNDIRVLAQAAYALWYRDYAQLIALGRYICRDEPDVMERFPGVRSQATRQYEVDDEFDDVEDDVEDETDETDAGDEAVANVLEDPNAAA